MGRETGIKVKRYESKEGTVGTGSKVGNESMGDGGEIEN